MNRRAQTVKKEFYSEWDLEDLGIARVRTLRDWRLHKRGPKYVKAGRNVRYRLSDVEAWLASRTVEI